MAIIGKIRNHSALAVVIIGVAIFAFILGDIGRSTIRGDINIGEVNGVEMTYMNFEKKAEENAEMTKRSQQKQNLTNDEMIQIRNQVWTEFVRKNVYDAQFEKLGISVGENELVDLTTGANPHQFLAQNFNDPQTGVFNRQMFDNFMQNLDQLDPETYAQIEFIIDLIEEDTKTQKYNTLISKGFYTPKAFLEFDYQQKNSNVEMDVVQVPYKDIPDSTIVLTDADYQKYYDENKNRYKQPTENRAIEYIIFDVQPSQADFELTQRQVMDTYKEFSTIAATEVPRFIGFNTDASGGYDSSWKKQGVLPARIDSIMFNSEIGTTLQPFVENQKFFTYRLMDSEMHSDTMDAQHILISYQGAYGADSTVTRTKDQAEKMADSLSTVLKKGNTASFMSLMAMQYSNDPSAKENQGEFKRFADGSMVPEFNEAVQKGKKGDIVVVETLFGYHVIKIGDKNAAQPNVRVAMIERDIVPSSQTIQIEYSKASVFVGENRTMEAFREAAQTAGYNIRTYEAVATTSTNIPGLAQPRSIVQWVYNDKTKKGDVSEVFETENQFVIATLTDIKPKGFRSLESVKASFETLVIRDKKAEILTQKIVDANATDLNQLATALNTTVSDSITVNFASFNVSNFGREPEVIGHALGMNEGSLSKPIKGNNGVYVVKNNKINPAAEKTDFDNEKRTNQTSFSSRVANMLQRILEEKSDVVDNRVKFY
ncbi:MAG: SurA N-terminal domain-containing protein [Bacteroidales bacterium]|nr:SurA N-terminal domain-containing protein [Bacteroidales bacterium]